VNEAAAGLAPASADALAACIDACLAARAVLVARVGLEPPSPGAPEVPLERLMRDCSEVCHATAHYLRSESVFIERLCEACATLCEECADACLAAGCHHDAVQACRDCANRCRALIGTRHASQVDPGA